MNRQKRFNALLYLNGDAGSKRQLRRARLQGIHTHHIFSDEFEVMHKGSAEEAFAHIVDTAGRFDLYGIRGGDGSWANLFTAMHKLGIEAPIMSLGGGSGQAHYTFTGVNTVEQGLESVVGGNIHEMDLLRVTSESTDPRVVFMSGFGGIDALMCALRKGRGYPGYIPASLKALFRHEPQTVHLKSDYVVNPETGAEGTLDWEFRDVNVCLANTNPYWGKWSQMVPHARHTQGLAGFSVYCGQNRRQLVGEFLRSHLGKVRPTHQFLAKHVEVDIRTPNNPGPIQLNGSDINNGERNFTVDVLPGRVHVYTLLSPEKLAPTSR